MKNNFFLLLCGLLLAFGQSALAQTPDGETPSEELICGEETGALKGLCNAYCEAMDCDLNEAIHGSPKACAKVLDNYLNKSGGENPPCLDSGCAATAAAAANEVYANCITNGGCDTERKCASLAKKIYLTQLNRCVKQCRHSCTIEHQSCKQPAYDAYIMCLADANHDPVAVLACQNTYTSAIKACDAANTVCTNSCTGPHDPYVPPSSCP